MKPHEETWTASRAKGHLWRVTCATPRDGTSRSVCTNATAEEAALIAAAPELARALVACGDVIDGKWHTGECINADDPHGACTQGCIEARDALVKAGALP